MSTLTFLGSASDPDNLTTYTHTISFGTESSDRKIIVMGASVDTSNFNISSITIGGVSATVLRVDPAIGNNYQEMYCAIASVPTGTSGNVVVTYGGQMSDNFIVAWAATGIKSNTYTDYIQATADPASGTIDYTKNGIVVGLQLSTMYQSGSATWTGLTEDYDTPALGAQGDYQVSCASHLATETAIGATVSCDVSSAGSCEIFVVSFPGIEPFTNPTNAYSSNDLYATCSATSGVLSVEISKNGGSAYSSALMKTYTATEAYQTYGDGSVEKWGMYLIRSDMTDSNFKVRVSHGDYSQVYGGFGFTTGTEIITGVEIKIEAKYTSSTMYIDNIQVKIYYGTSSLQIQEGSVAFASDGRKNGEGAGAGTGVLCFYDGSAWIASDTGATVAA